MDKAEQHMTLHRSKSIISLAISAIILAGCATGGTGNNASQPPADPPKSLTPLPPPGYRAPDSNNQDVVVQPVAAPDSTQLLPQASHIEAEPLPVETVDSITAELQALDNKAPATSAPAVQPVTEPVSLPLPPASPPANSSYTTPVASSVPATSSTAAKGSDWINLFPNMAEEYREFQEITAQLEQAWRRYKQKADELRRKAGQVWGDDNVQESSRDKYVKYGDGYGSRGEVDFARGNILVETAVESGHQQRLKDAIVATLLTPDDMRDPELFSDKHVTWSGPSVLSGQVRDHDGVLVQWEWRAKRYADWLVANKLQRLSSGGRTIYRIEIPMEANHQQVRGQKYESLVRQAAQRYGVAESLIYSIMETESHFNPYATSHIPAYGLMQVVPSTAGKDVFQRIKKKSGQPTRSYLFNPANNIDTGTAYLSILDDIYLKDVTHPLSREYCIISAYNGGAGNVLKTFSRDRKHAVQVINSLTPQQVYLKLNRNHPSAESRRYIEKVVQAKQKYDGMAVALAR